MNWTIVLVAVFWLGITVFGIVWGWRVARFNRDHPIKGSDDP